VRSGKNKHINPPLPIYGGRRKRWKDPNKWRIRFQLELANTPPGGRLERERGKRFTKNEFIGGCLFISSLKTSGSGGGGWGRGFPDST